MEILEEERSSHEVLNIQYNVHFSNSEDCSSSSNSPSASNEDIQSYDQSMMDDIKWLSDPEKIDDAYHNRFALDLVSKLHKSVSFINFDIPKFEMGNLDNNNNIIEFHPIKQEVNEIEQKQDSEISVHESWLSMIDGDENNISESDYYDVEVDHLSGNLLLGNIADQSLLGDIIPNNRSNTNIKEEFMSSIKEDNDEIISNFDHALQNDSMVFKQDDDDKSSKELTFARKSFMSSSDKQFICPEKGWGKKFLDNSKLKRHRLVHSGEKPYKCHIWNKKFSLDFNLRTHIRTHTGEKPYICDYMNWGKRFTQSSNLTAHLKTHSIKGQLSNFDNEEESLNCSNNEYSFSEKSEEEEEEEESCKSSWNSNYPKVFNVWKIKKRDLLLIRNKVHKVFFIHKYKPASERKYVTSIRSSSDYSDTPLKKVYGDIFRIERYSKQKKQPIVKHNVTAKIPTRIWNEYSDKVEFKIEKVRRSLVTPFMNTINWDKKVVDIDSASTKRSSRESSKQKMPTSTLGWTLNIEPINLVKIEQEDPCLKIENEDYPHESDLFLLNKNKNEELQKEIQDFNIAEHFDQDIAKFEPTLQNLHMEIEMESISSFHEEEFDEAYRYVPEHEDKNSLEFKMPHLRPRGISGCNDFSVLNVAENNCFLFSSERETPNFEPFATKQLFSGIYTNENK